jgi:hypothetical protein
MRKRYQKHLVEEFLGKIKKPLGSNFYEEIEGKL